MTAVEPLLKRIAAERLVLVSTGGSDWIGGSGEALKVDSGYRITARKVFFFSLAGRRPPDDRAILRGSEWRSRRSVALHICGATRLGRTWRSSTPGITLGMRGSGSHDVMINGHVVPEAAIAMRRLAGEWHPVFHIIATIALPLIYAVYVGVAEGARDAAVAQAQRKASASTIALVGRMETELLGAQLALRGMLATLAENAPSAESVNQVMMGRSLVARHALAVGELALRRQVAQGSIAKPVWSSASAICRVRAFIRCKGVRKRTMLDGWRSASRSIEHTRRAGEPGGASRALLASVAAATPCLPPATRASVPTK